MKKPLQIFFLLFAIGLINFNSFSQDLCGGVESNPNQSFQINIEANMSCGSNSADYTNHYRYLDSYMPTITTAEKIIHVNIIVWQEDNNTPVTNWQDNPTHRAKLTELIDLANAQWLNVNEGPSDPVSGVTEIPNFDKKYHMKLEGIYFFQNSTEAHSSQFSGKHTFLETNAPELLNQLNIHLINRKFYINGALGHSNGSKAKYPAVVSSDNTDNLGYNCIPFCNGAGSCTPCPISIAEYPVGNYYRLWNYASHIAHEVSHNVDLLHVYQGGNEACSTQHIDYMDDLFPQNAPYCNPPAPPSGCDVCVQQMNPKPQNYTGPFQLSNDGWTNNLMNGDEGRYITPKQAGKIHRAFALHNIGSVTSGFSETPIEITQNETWDFQMQLYQPLLIKTGSTLTIKCKLLMPEQGNIIIEPGAKLVIDGGIITKSNMNAGNSWAGILVYGNSNLPQTPQNQGTIEIINQGTIEHAVTGITNAEYDANRNMIWGTTGGIIIAEDAHFVNNNRDVQLLAYHNYIGSYEKPYKASFLKCTFERNNLFAQDDITASISMWEVNGVSVTGCKFINEGDNGTKNFQHDEKSYGIFALSSQLQVNEYHPGNSSTHTPTTFEGYNYGIHASNVCRADKFTTIANSTFTNNKHGVYLNTHANARVVKNIISIPDIPIASSQAPLYGFYFDASTGYTFAQNTVSGAGADYQKVGAVFYNNGSNANLAYKNRFDNLTYGTEAIGNNNGTDTDPGLMFQCNNYGENDNNTADLTVWKESGNPNPQGIQASQGFYDPGISTVTDLANNLFSRNQQDVYNEQGAYKFNYYHGLGESRYAPINPYNITVHQIPLSSIYATVCPDVITSGIGIPGDLNSLRAELSADDGGMGGKRALYSQLLNGGNTPELEAEILFAGQQDYANLYIELMSISPYVDEGQLINLINNTGFPELALRNVLVANPHSGRNPEVINALLERQPAVSQQTISDVETRSQTITAKDVLEAQMAGLSRNIARSLVDIQYHYITDTLYWDTDSLANLFAGRAEPSSVLQLADYYAQQAQFAQAQSVLNNADQTWWGETDVLTSVDATQYYGYLASAAQNGEGMHSLSTATRNTLQNLQSTTASTWLWHKINAVLTPYGQHDESYTEPVYFGGSNKTATTQNRPAKALSSFKLYPNPAKDYFIIKWDWMAEGLDSQIQIDIITLTGQLVKSELITDYAKNIHAIETTGIIPGIYLLRVNDADGNQRYEQKVSIIK